MSLHSNTPHNNSAKRFFTDLLLVREFLALNLPQALAKMLDLSTLQIIDGEFVDENHRSHQSDILYQVDTISGSPIILYILIEHKSNPDKWAVLQLLRYMLNKWEQDVGNGADQLIPIVPILFYHGQTEWGYPTNFQDYFPQDEIWHLFLPTFEVILQDYSEKAGAEIAGSFYLQSFLRSFRAIKAREIYEAFVELVNFMLSNLELDDPRGLKTIDEIGYYWSEGTPRISPDEFEAVFKRFGRKGEMALETFATKLRTEGRAEGERIGVEKMIIKLLDTGQMTHAEIAALVDLPLAEIERIDKDRHANA